MSENQPLTGPQNELTGKIRQFVVQRFPLAQQGELDDEQDLLQTGVIDSLGILELVNFLAEEFGVIVADDELLPENFSSIRRLAVFVETKR